MDKVDVLVIGAGVVGLAIAREYAIRGREVLVIEQHDSIGTETSSRNSEVIHSGIYYVPGSLKAKLCVAGKALLYDYCQRFSVPHDKCGKLILATQESQFSTLKSYQMRALENGAGELRWLDKGEVEALEPNVYCLAGIHSDSTGIIDSHAYMLSLQGEIESHGGSIALRTALMDWSFASGLLSAECGGVRLAANIMINAAGLSAPDVANMCRPVENLKAFYAKGHYYSLSGKAPFNSLVYPVAESGGLGVHVTLDLAGQARFGPDVCWIDSVDYHFNDASRADFIKAIKNYYPGLNVDLLQPGYTGIRPKLKPKGEQSDFLIETECAHGIPGLINLAGIESPGLTASLAIAEYVYGLGEAVQHQA